MFQQDAGKAPALALTLLSRVDVSLEETQAVLAALALLAGERKLNAAYALAELLGRRRLERPCETLVAWAREILRVAKSSS
jgi:hypothetical protein